MHIGQILYAIQTYPREIDHPKVFEVKYYSIDRTLYNSDKRFKDEPANNTRYYVCDESADEKAFIEYIRLITEDKQGSILSFIRSLKKVDRWPDFHPGGLYDLPLVKGKE